MIKKHNIVIFRKELNAVQRLDVVWDVYHKYSLKSSTRITRGHGIRRRVTGKTKIPKGSKWSKFLRDENNKQELFEFLAEKVASISVADKEVYVTKGEDVLSAHKSSLGALSPCNHEEADSRFDL